MGTRDGRFPRYSRKTKNGQALLRLASTEDESDSGGGYTSGRKTCRGMPDAASMASTRSAGTRPDAIHPDTVPCDFSPKSRARALCPPTFSHAARIAALYMPPFNATRVKSVNAYPANAKAHSPSMGREAESEGSAFWQRLVECWAEKGLPTSQNGVAKSLPSEESDSKTMSQGSVRRWFTGENYPAMPTLIEIARRGDVTIDWLVRGTLPKRPAQPGSPLERLLNVWELLPDEQHRGRGALLRDAERELQFIEQTRQPLVAVPSAHDAQLKRKRP